MCKKIPETGYMEYSGDLGRFVDEAGLVPIAAMSAHVFPLGCVLGLFWSALMEDAVETKLNFILFFKNNNVNKHEHMAWFSKCWNCMYEDWKITSYL